MDGSDSVLIWSYLDHSAGPTISEGGDSRYLGISNSVKWVLGIFGQHQNWERGRWLRRLASRWTWSWYVACSLSYHLDFSSEQKPIIFELFEHQRRWVCGSRQMAVAVGRAKLNQVELGIWGGGLERGTWTDERAPGTGSRALPDLC